MDLSFLQPHTSRLVSLLTPDVAWRCFLLPERGIITLGLWVDFTGGKQQQETCVTKSQPRNSGKGLDGHPGKRGTLFRTEDQIGAPSSEQAEHQR